MYALRLRLVAVALLVLAAAAELCTLSLHGPVVPFQEEHGQADLHRRQQPEEERSERGL